MNVENDAMVTRRAARLSALLLATDLPAREVAYPAARIAAAPRRPLRFASWRVAAALALLAAGVVAVAPPLRAWMAERAVGAWAVLTGRHAAPEPPPVPSEAASSVAFVPVEGRFVIVVAVRQAAGSLTLGVSTDSLATASAGAGTGRAEWVVLPDGLRLLNEAGATRDVAVRVPASISRVEIRIADEPAVVAAPAAEGVRRISLERR